MFSCEFCEILKAAFLQNTSGQPASFQENNMSRECTSAFEHWKTFSKTYELKVSDKNYELSTKSLIMASLQNCK